MSNATRQDFIDRLEANEDDELIRTVYADWLDEQGEYDEAERQRKWTAAKKWLTEFSAAYNYGPDGTDADDYYPNLDYKSLLDLGREALDKYDPKSDWGWGFSCGANRTMQGALYDNKEEFWRNWSIITGVPLPPGFVENSYFGCAC